MNSVICFVALWCLFATTALFAQNSSQSELVMASESGVLPDLVVQRKNGLANVLYEADHSISLTKLDIETVQKVLASGDGVVVNFDLEFASDTAVLTAEGKHVIDVLLGALKYIRLPTQYEVQVHAGSSRGKRSDSLSEVRAQALLSRLSSRYGSKHQFVQADESVWPKPQRTEKSSDRVDVWSFSVASMGAFEKGQ